MTRTEIEARITRLITLGGYTDTTPAPDLTSLANQGVQAFSWDTECNIETATVTTIAGQAEYTIDVTSTPRMFKWVLEAIYGTTQELMPTTEEQLRRLNRLWLFQTNAQPDKFWSPSPNIIRLYPPPADAGVVVTLRGVREAATLASGSTVPGFPAKWHEAIALNGAIRELKAWATKEESARLNMYINQYEEMVEECGEWVRDNDADIVRTVLHRPVERTNLGYRYGGRNDY